MKQLITIPLLFLIAIEITAQNRIANSSFEYIKPHEPSDVPNSDGQADKIEAWYSQVICCKKENVNSSWVTVNCDNESSNFYDAVRLHSPDWFSRPEYPGAASTYPLNVPSDEYPGGWIIANSGSKFVGLAAGELIQQRLYDGQHLTPGNTYYLSFYVQLFREARFPGTYGRLGANPPNNDARIKITAGAQRLKYKNNHPDDRCDSSTGDFSTYLEKQESEGGLQHIVTLGTIDISAADFPYYEWHQVWIEFVAPEHYGLNHHDWISIELQDWGEDICQAYIGIDDVSLMECPPTESCSPTYGSIWPTFSGSHKHDEPWRITDISNAEHVNLEIWPMMGGDIAEPSVSCSLGFPNGWEWDGKNSQGAEFAAGPYVYDMVVTNQCGSSRHTGTFVKLNSSNNPTDESGLTYGCGGITYVPPKPCCEYEPIMYVDDQYWLGQELLFHASSELIVASNAPVTVGQGSNVIMRAGERIELNAGFSSTDAEYFLAEIVPCGSVGPAQKLSGETEEPELESVVSSFEQLPSEFNIHPNPNSGTFTISGTDMQQIAIMEASGKLVRQMAGPFGNAVEVNGLGAGLYVVRVQMEDGGVETGRVVVTAP